MFSLDPYWTLKLVTPGKDLLMGDNTGYAGYGTVTSARDGLYTWNVAQQMGIEKKQQDDSDTRDKDLVRLLNILNMYLSWLDSVA